MRDPRTGRTERYLAGPALTDLDEIARRLRRAQPGWEGLGATGRAEVLKTWLAAIGDSADGLRNALVSDTGRHRESEFEVDMLMRTIGRWARLATAVFPERRRSPTADPAISLASGLRPYPLVGIIGACSYPLLTTMIDAVSALLAGCTAVVKPSEITPRFVEPLMQTVNATTGLAPVLQVVEGAGSIGAGLVDRVDAVVFTGSVTTGRAVAARCAGAMVPTFLDLGGKNAAVVLPGADLDRAAAEIASGGTTNAGQSCLAVERIYVDRSVHDEFVDRLLTHAKRRRLARPTVHDGEIGPFIDPDQADVVARQLADALAKGAVLRSGQGVEWLDGGAWCRPAVLTGVDHSMLVMTEQTFGPVLPVMPVDGVDEAVALVNDSRYGYAAAVFDADAERAEATARRLDAGIITVNTAPETAWLIDGEHQPFKQSGLGGPRGGLASMSRFLRRQSVVVAGGDAHAG